MALVEEDRLLTAKEAGKMLGISWRTMYQYAARGLIPSVRWQRNVRFRYSDLVRWMGEHTQVAPK